MMGIALPETLFKKNKSGFNDIREKARSFSANYCGSQIIRSMIFRVISGYAQKKETSLEILRYPFNDDELWAFTFVKKGTIFLCVNSDLALCKQIFSAAHELYHIYCYISNSDVDVLQRGSVLNSKTADELAISQEDLEANAFAGLLLMPDDCIDQQVKMMNISTTDVKIDDILSLMEVFALPYKATILRLLENGTISVKQAEDLYGCDSSDINRRISLTGIAQEWQQNVVTPYWGSLRSAIQYNDDSGFLTDERVRSDQEYINELENSFSQRRNRGD